MFVVDSLCEKVVNGNGICVLRVGREGAPMMDGSAPPLGMGSPVFAPVARPSIHRCLPSTPRISDGGGGGGNNSSVVEVVSGVKVLADRPRDFR